MKKSIYLCSLLCIICSTQLDLLAVNRDVVVIRKGGDSRFWFPNPAEIPDLYFDDETLSLTIDGSGAVSYYEVTITSATTSLTFLYTVVDGDYDTIDISYLPAGDTYVITLTTPGGTEYEGSIAL